MTYRLHTLDLLSEWHYRQLYMDISTRGDRKQEPDGGPREVSQVLQKVLDRIYSRMKSATRLFNPDWQAAASIRPSPKRRQSPLTAEACQNEENRLGSHRQTSLRRRSQPEAIAVCYWQITIGAKQARTQGR